MAGRFEVVHDRKFGRGEGSVLPAHRAALLAAVAGRRGKRYLKRQQLLEVGEPALAYLTEIVHRRPKLWVQEVDRLHELLQRHGTEPLRRAFQSGLRSQLFSARQIERTLNGSLQERLFEEGVSP